MATGRFNVSKGYAVGYAANVEAGSPANSALVVMILTNSGIVADGVMQDYDTVAAILAGASNEAAFDNYARANIANVAVTLDDTADENSVDGDDVSITAAGGTTDETLAKVVVYYDADTTAGTDANAIPISHHDVSLTTNGGNLTIAWDSTGIFAAT